MTSAKCRSLETAAVKHAGLPMDSRQIENHTGKMLMANGKGNRQCLKQLAVDQVSHFFNFMLIFSILLLSPISLISLINLLLAHVTEEG